METELGYLIKVVARRTGLTPHGIRAWEKRYGVVSPMRTATNRRLYSEADIERLRLLRQATLAGHSIGQIAQWPAEKLLALVEADQGATSKTRQTPQPGSNGSSPQSYLDACIAAVQGLDADALQATLTRAAVSLSRPVLMEQVILPLMHQIGELWREGTLRVAHEHLASAVVRSFLGTLEGAYQVTDSAPHLVVTTLAGQLHELGALIAAATAASEGWRVTYLGPNLPAEEIAGAVQQNRAKALALSIVYPADDPHVTRELEKLRRYLPEEVVLIVGGRAADAYSDVLDTIGAIRLQDMPSLRVKLEALRSGQPLR